MYGDTRPIHTLYHMCGSCSLLLYGRQAPQLRRSCVSYRAKGGAHLLGGGVGDCSRSFWTTAQLQGNYAIRPRSTQLVLKLPSSTANTAADAGKQWQTQNKIVLQAL